LPARDHDRLVIAAQRGTCAGFELGLERAEVTEDVRPAEFVVERGCADRTVDHDVERRGDAPGPAEVALPRLLETGNAQMRNGEARETGLRLATASGRSLVADLAASTGRRARKRRDRGRMIVCLHLHQDVDRLDIARIHVTVHVGEPALALRAFDHRCVIAIRRQHATRVARVRVLDHREQRLRLALAVDDPVGIENLVATMLRVRLREHHQLDVGRVALQPREVRREVIDLVVGEREAETLVRRDESSAIPRDRSQRPRLLVHEEPSSIVEREDRSFGHAVVQRRRDRAELLLRQLAASAHFVRNSALDALDRIQSTDVCDVSGLAGPGREGARPRNDDDQALGRERRRSAIVWGPRAIGEQRGQDAPLLGAEVATRLHKMDEACAEGLDCVPAGRHRGEKSRCSEVGECRGARQYQHLGASSNRGRMIAKRAPYFLSPISCLRAYTAAPETA
jgi:hypothetical protein